MITNNGKNILAKYLIGQTPAYASYIAVGCGPTPIDSASGSFTQEQKDSYAQKNTLDFEMFRVPISSRGYVYDDYGVPKIVLTAELPTQERYEISEVGVFSAGSNPSAGAFDSRIMYSFGQTDGWENHTEDGILEIQPIYEALDGNEDNIIDDEHIVIHTNGDNKIFTNSARKTRYEQSRYLNDMLVVRGDHSNIEKDTLGSLSLVSGSHVHLTDVNLSLTKNAPSDQIKLAFSVINKNGNLDTVPDNVKIMIEFSSVDAHKEGQYSTLEIDIDDINFDGTGDQSINFSENRYVVITKELQELKSTDGFTWSGTKLIRIYTCITKDGEPSADYFVAFDGMRLENVSTVNPLYGLTGYSVIRNTDAETVTKASNTANYIEFRFSLDVS